MNARPAHRSSAARRYGGLALWLAVIVSPSVWVAAGLLAGGAALLAAPALLRVAARRAAERSAAEGAGESVALGRDPAAGRWRCQIASSPRTR